jgi:putative two-component system response regulator
MEYREIIEYTKDLNLLYLEDDEIISRVTVEILGDFFKTITVAQNGEEGYQKYIDYHEKNSLYHDLVITDLNMPIMDGEEFINLIHKVNKEQPIIVISAYNDSNKLIDLIQAGITNFLLKPVDTSRLMVALYKISKSIYANKVLDEYRKKLEEINKSLDDKIQLQTKEIVAIQRVSIEAIANMVETYDTETGSHVKRIEAYTKLMIDNIGDRYIVNDKEFIPFASLLHDIGKMMIPKEVLTKPSKLDKDEFDIIKKHAELGAQVLLKANDSFKDEFGKDSYLKIASKIAMSHHEKWDGSGYPKGLSKEDIPICARIVSIADVYDALRSKRVYKDSFSHEESVKIILDQKGTAFDPLLIDVFSNISDKFDDIFKNSIWQ